MNIKNILIAILIAALAWWFLVNYNSKPADEGGESPQQNQPIEAPETQLFSPINSPIVKPNSNTEICFAKFTLSVDNDGSYHKNGGAMRLNIVGDKVTGDSSYQIAGKDTWRSKIEGTVSTFNPLVIDGLEESSSEGVTSPKEKVKLVLNATEIEVTRPADSQNPSESPITVVSCNELNEFEGVYNYIQTKFDFSPDYLVLDYSHHTGYLLTSYFSNGESEYPQQKKNLSYVTDNSHKVLSVEIPGLTPIGGENPEGEADPKVMKLDMKEWVWVSALYNDGTELKPKTPGKFTLTFGPNGAFSTKTDCNAMGGKYEVKDNLITFSEMMSTLMFCEGSQEGDFAKLLENTASFFFTNRGELILELKFDSGTATFR